MRTKAALTGEDLEKSADAAVVHAVANPVNVMTSIVVDGSHLLWQRGLDGAAPSTAGMAVGKSRSAAPGRRESNCTRTSSGRAALRFGVRRSLRWSRAACRSSSTATCVGEIGVSGVKSEQDAAVARAGIAALGLG